MSSPTFQPAHAPSTPDEIEVHALYRQLLDGWNERSSDAMSAPFAEDGEIIGFDGSHYISQAAIASHLQEIFAHHPTPPYYGKVKDVRLLSPESAVLRAIAGIVPNGQSDFAPQFNTHQTVVAAKSEGKWRVVLYQNTPAQFHGRPELVENMTEELRELLK